MSGLPSCWTPGADAGTNERTGAPFTVAPGSAIKDHSENAALHAAFTAKEQNKWITEARADLAEEIRAADRAGVRQVDIVAATGYSRERVRQIVRAGSRRVTGSLPGTARPDRACGAGVSLTGAGRGTGRTTGNSSVAWLSTRRRAACRSASWAAAAASSAACRFRWPTWSGAMSAAGVASPFRLPRERCIHHTGSVSDGEGSACRRTVRRLCGQQLAVLVRPGRRGGPWLQPGQPGGPGLGGGPRAAGQRQDEPALHLQVRRLQG